jgi:FkbM family methyltransferase
MSILIYGQSAARRAVWDVFFRLLPSELTVKHRYTGDPLRLNSVRHKDHWLRGRTRHNPEMLILSRLVRPGDCVIGIGGDIGYVPLYLAMLVGPTGSVHVFEAGRADLPYLHDNIARHRHVQVVECAVGSAVGALPYDGEDRHGAGVTRMVPVTTVDSYIGEHGLAPKLIAITTTGREWDILMGARSSLRWHRPALVLAAPRYRMEIGQLLREEGYDFWSVAGQPLGEIPAGSSKVVCLPKGTELLVTEP